MMGTGAGSDARCGTMYLSSMCTNTIRHSARTPVLVLVSYIVRYEALVCPVFLCTDLPSVGFDPSSVVLSTRSVLRVFVTRMCLTVCYIATASVLLLELISVLAIGQMAAFHQSAASAFVLSASALRGSFPLHIPTLLQKLCDYS